MIGYADSHIGRVRAENQDVFRLIEVPGGLLALVLDGMGGVAGGRVAATVGADTFAARFLDLCHTSHTHGPLSETDVHRFFSHAVYHANQAVFERSVAEPALQGMGSTVSAAYITPAAVYVANMGDSRVYRLRDGTAKRLTRDDSYVQEMLDRGKMTEEEARCSRQKNLITRALGIAPYADFQFVTTPLAPGDAILLVSDGVTAYYTDAELGELSLTAAGPRPFVQACLSGACERGGADNITAIYVSLA